MDKYIFTSFRVKKLKNKKNPSIKDNQHLPKRNKNPRHWYQMGFAEVIWKWWGETPANRVNACLPLELHGRAGCFKMHGKRSEPIAGKRRHCSQPMCKRSELRKKLRIPGPPGHWQLPCVCMCVCATDWQKWQTESWERSQSSLSRSVGSPTGPAVVCYQHGLLKEQSSRLLLCWRWGTATWPVGHFQ